MNSHLLRWLLVFILGGVVLSACGAQLPSATPTATDIPSIPKMDLLDPSIRGVITDISHLDGKVSGIFVEGKLEEDTSYDRASIDFIRNPVFYEKRDSQYFLSSSDKLEVGQTVEVLFIGAISASAPVQASAEEVVILTE